MVGWMSTGMPRPSSCTLAEPSLYSVTFTCVSIAAHGLVDGVVHDLPQHMVETPAAGGADIHTRTHPHCVQPFQNLNTAGVILLCHEV